MSLTALSVAELQAKQLVLRGEIYAAGLGSAQSDAANAVYEQTVVELRGRLPDEAPAGLIDCDLACLYSDLYKDEFGCRPRLVSYADARAYVDSKPTIPA